MILKMYCSILHSKNGIQSYTWVQAIYFMLNRFFLTNVAQPPWRQQQFSKRCCSLNAVKPIFKRRDSTNTIKSPDIRLTFTWLCVDFDVYFSYLRSKKNGTYMFPLCYKVENSVKHLLFWCPPFQDKIKILYEKIKNSLPSGHGWMI